ncbi:MAG: DUF2961 domain-containing protein, partial [Candidatus Latescibacterota bacterium]
MGARPEPGQRLAPRLLVRRGGGAARNAARRVEARMARRSAGGSETAGRVLPRALERGVRADRRPIRVRGFLAPSAIPSQAGSSARAGRPYGRPVFVGYGGARSRPASRCGRVRGGRRNTVGIPWRGRIAGVAVLALAGCGGGGGDARVFEFLDGDLARLAEPCDAKSVMFSSFDRTGKNDDGFSGLFSRLRIDDNGEHVLAEMDGPGCLKRIWMTWPGRSTRVRIYIDGRADPVLDLPTEELFSGARPPFLAPFVGGDREFGGINFSYVPVPFAKSIRVTTVDPIRFYQINAAAYPAGTEIESFSFPASRSFARRIEEARRAIAALPDTVTLDMPWTSPMRPGDEVIEFTDSLPYEIRAHAPRPALVIDRAGEIVEMRIGLEEPGAAWRVVRLLVRWDGEEHPSIAAPLSDLFGSAFRSVRVRSAAMLASSCTGVLRLPMPFESARIELRRTWMDGPARARVRVLFRPRDVGPEEGRLHATSSDWRADAPDSLGAGVPYLASLEHTVVRARGRGHFVGTLVSARGGATHSFLEGDETVVVDGDLR